MEVIVATNNAHKLSEIRKILGEIGWKVISLKDANIDIEIEETGVTFEENALIKGREICKITGKMCIADDSGLEVLALNGEPGVYSARYAGVDGDNKDAANNKELLKRMQDIPEGKRQGRFCCVIAAVFPDGRELTAKGYINGRIGYFEKGKNGFGYDPLFIIDGLDKTMAELDFDEKNKISHRSKALIKIKESLESLI